jgi:hypothetical protein
MHYNKVYFFPQYHEVGGVSNSNNPQVDLAKFRYKSGGKVKLGDFFPKNPLKKFHPTFFFLSKWRNFAQENH